MAKTKSKRSRIVLIAASLLLVGLGVWYATRAKSSTPKTASTSSVDSKTDTSSSDQANKNDPTLDKKNQTTPATTAPAQAKKLYITVSRPVNNDMLPLAEGIEIRSVISGATSGTCNVVATGPGGKTVTKSASLTAQTSYGSCSIDIASSQVVAGEWQVAMTVTSGSATGSANFKVTVQ